MSTARDRSFDLDVQGMDPLPDGSSVLLTGEDLDTLESVFFSLISPPAGEHPLVVSTVHDARTVQRHLDTGPGTEPSILTTEPGRGADAVTHLEDVGNLTDTGMQLSAAFQERGGDPIRAGLFQTVDLCRAADDTRAVFRFLNSSLLTHLRRQSAVGVLAVHTDVDVQANVESLVSGMERSFSGRMDVADAGRSAATVAVEGLGTDGEFTVAL